MTEAMPMAKPPMTRQKARSHSAKGSAEPTALMVNSIAAICMQRMRPIRSAIRPAVAAPIAQPIRAMAMTWAERAGADVVTAADRLDGAVDHGAVVAEQEAAHRGRRGDEDDMAEVLGQRAWSRSGRCAALCWST